MPRGPNNKKFGAAKRLREQFQLDPANPLAQQQGESDLFFERFNVYLNNQGLTLKELEPLMGVSYASVSRYAELYCWKQRIKLAKLAEIDAAKTEKGELSLVDRAVSSKLPPPPPPIEKGLKVFALQYGPLIAPGFELDAIVDVMLTELEAWVEGKFGGRLLMNPPPRSSPAPTRS